MTAMINVGFYIGDIDLHSGGVAPYMTRVLSALAAGQVAARVDLRTIGNARPPLDPRFPFVQVPEEFKAPLGGPVDRLLTRVVNARRALAGRPVKKTPCELAAFLATLNLDVLHVPYQIPPTYESTIPLVVTMHDVQEIHLPQYFTAEDRRDRAIGHLWAIRNARAIVVSYEHVRQDLIRYFNCPEDQVVIVPVPVSECTLRAPTATQSRSYEQKYAPYPAFFLYPAQTWEHKNHLRLIDALDLARQRVQSPLSLVCTGKRNEFFSIIRDRLHSSPASPCILFTDIVPEAELHWLYKNCLGVVIPTLYEAGSFPLFEAMQLGAPVVCANTTSLPEAVGDAQFVFDPRDIEQIAAAMIRLAVDAEFRAASIRNGRRQIIALQNIDIAEHYEALWSRVARVPRAPSDRLLNKCA